MKKVLLLTLHSQNNNFGSVLQAYSLYKYIEGLGCEVTVLNYQPYYNNGAINIKKAIKKLVINTIFFRSYYRRAKRFNLLQKQERSTIKLKNFSSLKQYATGYDVYVIGSDQVWNPAYLCGKDAAYYYKFVDQGKKISYAASMGTQKHDINTLKFIACNIKDFQHVSLRERVSVTQLNSVGYDRAHYVLDPVFLLDVSQYRKMQSQDNHTGYILAYIIHKDKLMVQIVDELAKITRKRVIQIGGFASKCNYDEFPREAGPFDFLSLVDHADFVITSSFHGAAFAHIYQKQFAVVMPNENTLRIENILETAGTQDRVIRSLKDVQKMLTPINYKIVNERINEMRQESKNYLINSLADEGTIKS